MASTSVRRNSEDPNRGRPRTAGRVRIWSPFAIAYVGGTLALLFQNTIGEFLDVCNPLFGCLLAEIYAGVPIGLVAALASRTWKGVLTFVLGLLATSATFGIVMVLNAASANSIVFALLYFALWLGLLGVPTYAIVTGIAYVVSRMATETTKKG